MSLFERETITGVLIVGAGPTGLALAIALQQASVDYLFIDKLAQGQNTSRAGVIHAHTLEVLSELGVSKQLTERGPKVSRFSIRDRDRALMQLPFDNLPSPHPYLLTLPQNQTESILEDRLAVVGGVIHRGVTAVEAKQDRNSATVRVQTVAGESTIRARYLVGGDGIHSVVRGAAGREWSPSDPIRSCRSWPEAHGRGFEVAGTQARTREPNGRSGALLHILRISGFSKEARKLSAFWWSGMPP